MFNKIVVLVCGLGFLLASCEENPFSPSIDSIDPVFGSAETLVTIEGSGLGGISEITFSGVPINFNNAYNADHALLFRIPSDVPLGEHEVVLTTEGGSVTTNFKVTFDAPEIFEVFPESAAPGDIISIRGENFFEPIEVYFFDSIQAQVVSITPDSIRVTVPSGIEKGFIRVIANGGTSLSPQRFFTTNTVLINDFDGNGIRAETNKWIFQGSVKQNALNAVQNSNPTAVAGNFLKLSGSDDLNIQWIGGAQNHFGFPGDSFETFGLSASPNNILLELDVNNNGKDNTYIILILNEKDGSPNDFTQTIKLDKNGWERISIPLNRFTDLNDVIVDPTKVRVVKVHLIDEEGTGTELEVNIDNLQFTEIF